MTSKADRIRAMNDALRKHGIGGEIYATSSLMSLGLDVLKHVVNEVTKFSDFNPNNDPYQEHDFGIVQVGDIKVMFKIDYYEDATKTYGAADPSDPNTVRVMTVGLPSDF